MKNRKSIFIALLLIAAVSLPLAAADTAVVWMFHRFGEVAHPSINITKDQLEAHLEMRQEGVVSVVPLS